MSDTTEEPRRSVRATKGQHTKASTSPAPRPQQKPLKGGAKPKGKKKQEQAPDDDGEDGGEEEGEDDGEIRCICGDDNPEDKRAFIGCEACMAWQHNVCMGMPEDEDEVPEHYFCEECRPVEHAETLEALDRGEKIWETRTKEWKAWKKMSANRRKSKGKGNENGRPPWLRKEGVVPQAEEANGSAEQSAAEEGGNKRKRESVKVEQETAAQSEASTPVTRPDKRRKSAQATSKIALDPDTAVIEIDDLPTDRKRIAQALSKTIYEDIQDRVKSSFRIPDGHTPKSLSERLASLIEYEMFQVYDGTQNKEYAQQFRNLNANLKRNKMLIERLLDGSLRASDLATMESKDMASEELQREMKLMKEESDRQAVLVEADGPRYRQDHKGIERIEDDRLKESELGVSAQPVRERASVDEGGAGSPTAGVNVDGAGSPTQGEFRRPAPTTTAVPAGLSTDRRTSSQQQFDMNNIWQKTGTAQSPTTGTASARPMQMPPRRRSSIQANAPQQPDTGAKEDADIDRLLQDDDDEEDSSYEPQPNPSDSTIVWRGTLAHAGEGHPTVSARWIAGRDMTPTSPWSALLPPTLTIDGRLAVAKAEEYLCGLQWSQNSDVSVLALTPYGEGDLEGFGRVWEYFFKRGRYAVVGREGLGGWVRDLYVVPVEKGGRLPEHVGLLEFCSLGVPVEERLLLACFVVVRGVGTPVAGGGGGGGGVAGAQVDGAGGEVSGKQGLGGANGIGNGNGQQQYLPQHMRAAGVPGPAGSPLNQTAPTFSPGTQQQQHQQQPLAGYGVPRQPSNASASAAFPPNPYDQAAQPQPSQQPPPSQQYQPHPNPMIAEILGPRQWDPTAQQILAAQPGIDEDKLRNLRIVLEEDVGVRTDLEALGRKLGAGV
ncbi:lysyl-tRNA synthetase [Recurvomyces mirabilis]|nr:lysyl-tRNA synthetase [Recurvomyces mirabilis]